MRKRGETDQRAASPGRRFHPRPAPWWPSWGPSRASPCRLEEGRQSVGHVRTVRAAHVGEFGDMPSLFWPPIVKENSKMWAMGCSVEREQDGEAGEKRCVVCDGRESDG